jgi:hypothetical protein
VRVQPRFVVSKNRGASALCFAWCHFYAIRTKVTVVFKATAVMMPAPDAFPKRATVWFAPVVVTSALMMI